MQVSCACVVRIIHWQKTSFIFQNLYLENRDEYWLKQGCIIDFNNEACACVTLYQLSMYSTAYNLWTFTWFVHFELTFRLKGTEKIHTARFSKFPCDIYSILFDISAVHRSGKGHESEDLQGLGYFLVLAM